ncbi:MAG: XrtA system polysaccharide chain length determinant [Gemmatimonas sp.]
MDELLRQLVDRLRGMWHRRTIGLAVAWIVGIIAVGVALRIPERYEASARVYVDTQSLLRPLMAGLAIQPNFDQQVTLISRTLISRPNIEKLIRMADLDLNVKTNMEREELIDNLLKQIQLGGNAKDNLYIITYRNPDRQKARNVVQSMLTIFVESSLGDKRLDTRSAMKFVDEQTKLYEQNLQAAEDRLKQFKLKYMGITGTGQAGTDYISRLSKLKDDIESARLELHAAEQSRDAYKAQLAGLAPVYLPERQQPQQIAVPEIDARLAAQKSKLDELLRAYTDEHPDVVGTRRIIKQLEEQRAQEVEAQQKAIAATGRSGDASADANPVYQQMKVSLADAEANVAALRARLAAYEQQFEKLKAAAQRVPEAEAEYAQLTRDYDVQKKTYETLLARREAATMGVGAQDTGGTEFRVIDPPRVLPDPVPPTRIMLLALAIVASLLSGVAASFVANEILPTFRDARALRDVAARPVLGTVSLLPNESFRRLARRRAYLFAGGLGGLLASFGAALAFALLVGRVA